MREGKILEKDSVNTIYNGKKSKYITSLFDEVSEIEINGKKQLFYPHELEIVEKSDIQVKIENCYFKGNYYLVEAKMISSNKKVFFNSDVQIELNQLVFLQAKKKKSSF